MAADQAMQRVIIGKVIEILSLDGPSKQGYREKVVMTGFHPYCQKKTKQTKNNNKNKQTV